MTGYNHIVDMKTILPYLTLVVVMVVLDLIWLGGIAMPLYKRGIGHLMADKPNFAAAVLFYLLYAVGAYFLVVTRATSWQTAAAYGALFGATAYLTYDLTNMATLRDWPLGLSVIDVAWGTFATGVASVCSRLVAERFT
jgi:uncharacterized membrane protein